MLLCCGRGAQGRSTQEAKPHEDSGACQTVLQHGPRPGHARDVSVEWDLNRAGHGSVLPFDVAQLHYLPAAALPPASSAVSSPFSCATYGSTSMAGAADMGSITGWQMLAAEQRHHESLALASDPACWQSEQAQQAQRPAASAVLHDSALPAAFDSSNHAPHAAASSILQEM